MEYDEAVDTVVARIYHVEGAHDRMLTDDEHADAAENYDLHMIVAECFVKRELSASSAYPNGWWDLVVDIEVLDASIHDNRKGA